MTGTIKASYNNFVILGPSKRSRERRRHGRRNVSFLQSILMICESPMPVRRESAPRNSNTIWLETHLPNFFRSIGQRRTELHQLIVAHGDKCYLFRERWEKEGIPFIHGVAIYLLSRTSPYDLQVTRDIESWVVENYATFKPHLAPPEELPPDVPAAR